MKFQLAAFSFSILLLGWPALDAAAENISLRSAGCLVGKWETSDSAGPGTASYILEFDEYRRVLVSLSPTSISPSGYVSVPSSQPLAEDAKTGRLLFSLRGAGKFYLGSTPYEGFLVVQSNGAGNSARWPDELRYRRVSGSARCDFENVKLPSTDRGPTSVGGSNTSAVNPDEHAYPEYHPIRMLDGIGAVFIGIGEPVLFPIRRTKQCHAESGSDLHASGCGVVAFLVSPFLALRDGLLGLGDFATGGYFALSRRSGVFDYFDSEKQD